MFSFRNKTVFIVVEQGFAARYLLRTDIFLELRNSGAKIVILCPNHREDYLHKEFEGKNIIIEPLRSDLCSHYFNKSYLQKFFRLLRLFTHDQKYDVTYTSHGYRHYIQTRQKKTLLRQVYNLLFDLGIFLLRRSRHLRFLLIYLESALYPGHFHRDLFEKYRPSLLLVTSMGNAWNDRYIMREARRHKTKTVSIILSWDNPTTKGMAGAFSDHYIVWTDTMRQELMELHGIKENRIHVGGTAVFDVYFRHNSFMSRHQLFEKLSLKADRKLIFFCLMTPTQFAWNSRLLEILAHAITSGRIRRPANLLVRPHPIYYTPNGHHSKFQEDLDTLIALGQKFDCIKFDFPEILSHKMNYDMPVSEMTKLASIMKYTDVLVCYFSTLFVEAAILDVPVLNTGLFSTKHMSNEIVASLNHLDRVLKTQGIRSVYDEDELVRQINLYLDKPDLDREGRRRIVENEVGPYPGHAGRHIGQQLLNLISYES